MAATRRLRTHSGNFGVVRQAAPSNETRARQMLTPEALAAMSKDQLRAECRRRGQRSTGNKAELLARLGYYKLAAAGAPGAGGGAGGVGGQAERPALLRNGIQTQPQPPTGANSNAASAPTNAHKHNRTRSGGMESEHGLVLWRRPLATLDCFCRETLILSTTALHRLLAYKALVAMTTLLIAAIVASYFVSGPHQPAVHVVVREACWCGWWVVLGVCSSVGLGTGLHTFLLYLGPHIARVTLAAYECGSVDFPTPPYPDDIICPTDVNAKYAVSIWNIMAKVRVESMMWGIGTALGELPPYFMARAARLSGRHADALDELRVSEDSFTSRAKLAVQRLVQRVGFVGILLCASVPNPLFDLAGLTCGHFLVPFWTFFGATAIGKAVVKMHIQKLFVIVAFNDTLLQQALALVERVPYVGPKLEAPLLEFLRNQKARLHKKEQSAPMPENQGSVLSALLEKFVLAMVVYFVVSIVNALAQNYAKRVGKGKKSKKKE